MLPDVFSPIYSSDTAWFAEKIISLTKNKKFLEIGCGTGIISCLASIKGASHIVATDINPQAVKNTLLNAQAYSLNNISIRMGSVFDPLKEGELFDIIFWNHPFYYEEKDEELDFVTASVCDRKYEALRKFIEEGKSYLAKEGQLLLGSSNVARVNIIKQIAHSEGLKLVLLEKKSVPVYKGRNPVMDLRIYSLISI